MTGLILSIAVLVTGTIIPNVEAKGKPVKDEEPTSKINLSCNDRKDALKCKASSRLKIDSYTIEYIGDGYTEYNEHGSECVKSMSFGDPEIKESGTYVVTVHECQTKMTATFTIIVENFGITNIIKS